MMSIAKKNLRRFTLALGLALVALGTSAQEMQHVIVKTNGSREVLKRTIQAMGGRIDIEYQNVPAGLSKATFELTWEHDWTHYPTNDLDLVLIDPNNNLDFDGATLNGRERAVVMNPTPGQWVLVVVGFNVFGHAPQGDGTTPTPPGTDAFKVEIFLTP